MKRNRQAVQERRESKKAKLGRIVTNHAEQEISIAPAIQPKNEFQRDLIASLDGFDVTIAEAPAGSGKSFIVMSKVADWLKSGKIDKIILSRPAVGMGNTLGLLKGGMREKFEPYLLSLVDVITQRYGYGFYETCLSNKTIEFAPVEYIRGRSFNGAVVIIDEAQNLIPKETYAIMTRLGEESKMVFLGDRTQNDMKGRTGIEWAIDFCDRHGLTGDLVSVVEGDSDDIVRSGFCKAVVKGMEKDGGINR